MIFGLSVLEFIIISFLIVIMVNCVINYVCCSKCLTIYEEEKNVGKAIGKLKLFDQFIFSKINMIICLFYFGLGYWLGTEIVGDVGYLFFFSCVVSFLLALITMFVCRLAYCYTCNVLLETSLNEIDCLWVNFKRLIPIYLPFIIISGVIPLIYGLDLELYFKHLIFFFSLLSIVVLWIVLAPKVLLMFNKTKKIENNSLLRHRLVQMFEAHEIKKYELYYWDTSKSKEANAMVSGILKYHLLISTSLIESVTLPELESIVMHEIGHIKSKHLLKAMIGKIFVVLSLVFMVLAPYFMGLNNFYKVLFYILTVIMGFFEVIASISVERKYEMEADSYANSYSDPSLFASALKKAVKYEDEGYESVIDKLFNSHPKANERINKD